MTIRLDDRALVALEGEDAATLLQGIITNDVRRLTQSCALYAALLTPQGKYLFDFFLVRDGERIVIDCRVEDREGLTAKLMLYRLRARVDIRDVTQERSILADPTPVGDRPAGDVWREGACIHLVDPRAAMLGTRMIVPRDGVAPEDSDDAGDYRRHLIRAGIPEPALDAERERMLALEVGFDCLNAVDFTKGCYVGQELTARTHWRGKVRKQLVGLLFDGPAPDRGSAVLAGDDAIGEIRGATDGAAIAFLRLEGLGTARLGLEDGREARFGPRARAMLDAEAQSSQAWHDHRE